ncbi:MAG: hypothetical protein NC489_26100 [Ruminococcus flavefaciens]|nr:hypothetical protein [Ruminococcus flavefaciens]
MAQPERMPGNAAAKRKCWARKRIHGMDVHFSIKSQKKKFQRKVRNGKTEELPTRQRSAYKRVINEDAIWDMVP